MKTELVEIVVVKLEQDVRVLVVCFVKWCYVGSIRAPGSNAPWFICWFRHYI